MTNKKKHLPNNRRCFPKTKDQLSYFLGVAGAAPDEFDFIVEFDDMLFADGLIALLLDDVVFMLDGIAAVVETGAGVLAGVEGLMFALLAGVSPQAIPNAPRPRTAESTITFFICLRTPIFLKD